eukprot:2582834-Amphidinium_carterae.3
MMMMMTTTTTMMMMIVMITRRFETRGAAMHRFAVMMNACRTRAPYERSFPYHQWVMDEQRKCGKGRMNLAGPETLHMAHVLKEMDRGFFTGANKKSWTEHLLGAVTDDCNTVVSFCSRLEYQDGKRKQGTQRYHGRGTIHSHSLDFLENLEAIQLENKISAHVPEEDEDAVLRGIVLDSQLDRSRSNVPIREEESCFDPETNSVKLHHTQDDYDQHVRPFFPEALHVTKCHEDVQVGDGRGAMLRYVATYTSKFSGSFAKEWLNDAASDYSVARRVAFDFHPLEPEMWMSLSTSLFPQCSYGGTLTQLVVPWPGKFDAWDDLPELLKTYEVSEWRHGDMPLHEFARKCNSKGEIISWMKKMHATYLQETEDTEPQSLKEFANSCPMRSEKLVAASMVSRLRDEYYGQWMVLNIPYQSMEALLDEHTVAMVPDRYKFFACAIHRRPEYWSNEEQVRADMELEAYSTDHINTVLNLIRAQRHLVKKYLDGDLKKDDNEEPELDEASDSENGEKMKVHLDSSQKRLKRFVETAVERSMQASDAVDDDMYEALLAEAEKDNRVVAGLGPPGTGKTFVIHACIKKYFKRDARILFALPTGQLASEMRHVHPHIDVDTCHGAFMFNRDLTEALPIMTKYDLIIIDELSMLNADHMDRLYSMWCAASKLPCLVLLGDFWQLPSPSRPQTKMSDSQAWNHVRNINFESMHRCKDEKLAKKLEALRTSVPSKRLFKKILQHHQAWTTRGATEYDLVKLMRDTNNETTIVTCTRRGSNLVNDLVAKILFEHRHKKELTKLPCDWETNPENYDSEGKLKLKVRPKAKVSSITTGTGITGFAFLGYLPSM